MKYRFLSLIFFSISIFLYTQPQMQFPGAQNLPSDFPQMSEKDLNEMVNFLDGLSDEELKELENLGRQVLTDMGYDADTLEPLNPNTPPLKDLFPAQPSQPAAITEEAQAPTPLIAEPIVNTEELEEYLKKFLRHLHATQQKAQSPILEDRKLSRWLPELRDINFYITVIAHSEHIKRILAPEYDALLKHIKELGSALITYEPLIIIQEPVYEVTDDSYEILGITPHATTEDIEEAYAALKKQKSPTAVTEKLTQEGASEKDIKRAVKEAHLTMSLITDAYEKLQDPKTREQIDRERLAHTQQKGTLEKGSQKALDALAHAISTAVYTHQLLNELEQFIKKYEPVKLEQKKAMEKGEAERKKEQLEAEKIKVMPSRLGQLEPAPRASSGAESYAGGYPGYGYGAPYYPEYPSGGYDHGALPAAQGAAPKETKASGKPGKKEEKGEKKEGKEKGGEKEAKREKEGKKEEKQEESKIEKLIKDITKKFDTFKDVYQGGQAPAIQTAFKDLEKSSTEITEKFDEILREIKFNKPKEEVLKKYKKMWADFIKRHDIEDLAGFYTKMAEEENKKKEAIKIKTKTEPLTPEEIEELSKKQSKITFADVMEGLAKLTKKLEVESKNIVPKEKKEETEENKKD